MGAPGDVALDVKFTLSEDGATVVTGAPTVVALYVTFTLSEDGATVITGTTADVPSE